MAGEKNTLNAGNRAALNLEGEEAVIKPDDGTLVPANIEEPIIAGSLPPGTVDPSVTPVAEPGVAPVSDSAPVLTKVPDNDLSSMTLDMGLVEAEPDPIVDAEDAALIEVENTMNDEQQRKAFAKMRIELKTAKAAAVAIPAAAPDNTEAMTALQQQLDDSNEKLGKISLADSPDFQKKYNSALGIQMEKAARYAKAAGVDDSVMTTAIEMDDLGQRSAYVSDRFGDFSQTVINILDQIDTIDGQRQLELTDWRATKEILDAEANENQSFIQNDLAKKTFTSAVQALQDEAFLPFTYIEGNEPWNKTVDAIQAETLTLFQRDDLDSQAQAMARGVAAPHLMRSYLGERAKVADLTRQLAALGVAAPRANGAPQPQVRPQPGKLGNATAGEVGHRVAARLHNQPA